MNGTKREYQNLASQLNRLQAEVDKLELCHNGDHTAGSAIIGLTEEDDWLESERDPGDLPYYLQFDFGLWKWVVKNADGGIGTR